MVIAEFIPERNGSIVFRERLQKFICVHHNGETYVTWQKDKDAAFGDCKENSREGAPWKVLAYPAWM